MKTLFLKMRESKTLKKVFEITNLSLLFLIVLISLALYGTKPFNYINIGLFAIFCGIALVYFIIFRPKLKFDIVLVCLSVLLLNMIISYAVNGFVEFSKTPFLMTIVSAMIYLWMQDKKDELDLYLLVISFASWAFLFIYLIAERRALFSFSLSSFTRAGSVLGNENDIARHLVITAIINFFLIFKGKKIYFRIISGVMTFVALVFLASTGSISNIFLVMISLLIGTLIIVPKKWKLPSVLIVVGLITFSIILMFTVPQLAYFKKRILGIFVSLFNIGKTRADSSALQRLDGAIAGFQLFMESPLFGNGCNSVYRNYTIMAHNNIAEIAADYGLFALLFEEILLVYPLFNLKRINNKYKPFAIMLAVYIILLQFFLVIFNSKVESLLIPFLYLMINEKNVEERVSSGEVAEKNNGKMKVVELIPIFHPLGGAERFVSDLSLFIHKNYQDVNLTLISLFKDNGDFVTEELKKEGVNIIFLNKKKGFDLKCALDFKKVVANINPDIIHAHVASLFTIFLSGVYKNYKVVYTFHTTATDNTQGSKFSIKRLLTTYIFRNNLVNLVAISDVVKESIRNCFKLNDDTNIKTINNGVPTEKFRFNGHYSDKLYDFVYVGRIIPGKNVDKIIDSFSIISKEYSSSKLLIIGTGSEYEKCMLFAEEKHASNVDFIGFQHDVSKYLKQSKNLVMASDIEGNPIIVNEAIASKCFVVSTAVGGVPDVVNEDNGLLYSTDDLVENLKNCMVYCLEHGKDISTLLDDNYDKNLKLVSIEKTCNEYISYFKELCLK